MPVLGGPAGPVLWVEAGCGPTKSQRYLDGASVGASHIVGFSMGGNITQALALRPPGRVTRLVLASSSVA
jgi:pimeloyl-ACP methyl ester carboxylesterase